MSEGEPAPVDRILELDQLEEDLAVGCPRPIGQARGYGGLVLAQALQAAGRSVDASRSPHSLHAYFLRPADAHAPVTYATTRIRDGGSFSSRRVTASQGGRAIAEVMASFHRREDGLEYQPPIAQGAVPAAGGPSPAEAGHGEVIGTIAEVSDIDVRYGSVDAEGHLRRIWFRVRTELPPSPLHAACITTYVSDLTIFMSVLDPTGTAHGELQMASLDHAIWFHRRYDPNDWLVIEQRPASTAGARGLATGRFIAGGQLVATVAQEGLMRPRPTEGTQG